MKFLAAFLLIMAAGSASSEAVSPAPPPLQLWRLDCGDILIKDYNAFFSDTYQYQSGPKRLTDSCYLLRNGDRFMLWDTGLPGELAGRSVDGPEQTMSLKYTIVDQLREIGIAPEQIEIIGISHYHLDHLGQAADFPNAKLVIGKGDLDVLKSTSNEFIQPDRLKPWLSGNSKLVALESDADVFHDGRVMMLKMPGHTPGHYALLVRLASGPVLLSGDQYHFAEQVANRGVPPFNHDRADTLASHDRFERIARNLGAKTVIQHEPADIAKLPPFPNSAQ